MRSARFRLVLWIIGNLAGTVREQKIIHHARLVTSRSKSGYGLLNNMDCGGVTYEADQAPQSEFRRIRITARRNPTTPFEMPREVALIGEPEVR